MTNKLPLVYLKKNEERRILAGHLWIYSNEIDVSKSPLQKFTAGDFIEVRSAKNQFLGMGYINPQNLLCVRLLSREYSLEIDQAFLEERILAALELREALYSKPYYRLVYGESDFLPGLIVDRYYNVLVAQITTAGMESIKDKIIAALINTIQPNSIILRNDHSMRATENLDSYVEVVYGQAPDVIEIIENEVKFESALFDSQKTGWFYDHRDNRARLKHYVKNKRVLDVFSYIGGWGIQAAVFGAKQVYCVDSSMQALHKVKQNAQLNNVENLVTTLQGDAFESLKNLQAQNEIFDVIIVDPPAFIKRRKDIENGLTAYKRINYLALMLLAPGGILISSSCSMHLSFEMLQQVLLQASLKAKRPMQIIEQGHQGQDHPIHPAIPETAYLKSIFCRFL